MECFLPGMQAACTLRGLRIQRVSPHQRQLPFSEQIAAGGRAEPVAGRLHSLLASEFETCSGSWALGHHSTKNLGAYRKNKSVSHRAKLLPLR